MGYRKRWAQTEININVSDKPNIIWSHRQLKLINLIFSQSARFILLIHNFCDELQIFIYTEYGLEWNNVDFVFFSISVICYPFLKYGIMQNTVSTKLIIKKIEWK